MSLKKLRQFLKFDWEKFANGKVFMVTECAQWLDYNTKKLMGTKVKAAIVQDNTQYEQKEGEQVTNLFNTVAFKVPKQISIPVNSYVKPIGVTATVYGEYMNQLSIKCEDVQAVQQNKG